MYCHSLQVEKKGEIFEVQCEDMAVCEGVGIWPYQLEIDEKIYSNLIEALRDWADSQKFHYRIYVDRDHYLTKHND